MQLSSRLVAGCSGDSGQNRDGGGVKSTDMGDGGAMTFLVAGGGVSSTKGGEVTLGGGDISASSFPHLDLARWDLTPRSPVGSGSYVNWVPGQSASPPPPTRGGVGGCICTVTTVTPYDRT